VTRARIAKMSALVAGAALALSGCGLHPGAAAVVGDTTISGAEVDDAAAALCSANITGAKAQGQPKPDLASRGARQAAVQLLVDTELSQQFGEEKGVEPEKSKVSSAVAQNKQTLDLLPEANKADFEALLRDYAEGQLMLIQIGRQSLADSSADDNAALSEGTKLRNKWARSVDVEVDPRYGSYAQGTLTPASGSLSVPVSQRATAGANADPSATWVAALPMSQKCG
jgi:SurA-like protein